MEKKPELPWRLNWLTQWEALYLNYFLHKIIMYPFRKSFSTAWHVLSTILGAGVIAMNKAEKAVTQHGD